MGLLDDAIREHLELKRRRGADPGEVAREQREALDPVFPDEPHAWDGEEASGPVAEDVDVAGAPELVPPDNSPEPFVEPLADGPDLSGVGQETVELDMSTVLDQAHDAPVGASAVEPVFGQPASVNPAPEPSQEDSLEWEMPARVARQAGGDGGGMEDAGLAGQERLTFD